MKVLLTGATGYVGKRLLPLLIEQGHEVICSVRDIKRFPSDGTYKHPKISLFEIDFLSNNSFSDDIRGIDVAYYLIHSMSSGIKKILRS